MQDPRSLLGYMLSRLGCTHPFRLSRLLALAEIEALKRAGKRLTCLRYVEGPGVFYIEGLKELLDEDCFSKREGDPTRGIRGCIEYVCPPPALPGDVKNLIDYVIEGYSKLDDYKLNEQVLKNPLFKHLLVVEGSCS